MKISLKHVHYIVLIYHIFIKNTMKSQNTTIFQLIDKNYHTTVSNTTDIWELSNEKKMHEQQHGNYSFIVMKNNKKHIVLESNINQLLILDDFINE